ncbi:uncharacterized protein VTP21DRAFT_2517 [Calcarisporiella thermophila]|uniref:uncharacterized protein n=1 Tax=Calcarisporiella thermophila TaxID=911321 RepID=UPI00374362AA
MADPRDFNPSYDPTTDDSIDSSGINRSRGREWLDRNSAYRSPTGTSTDPLQRNNSDNSVWRQMRYSPMSQFASPSTPTQTTRSSSSSYPYSTQPLSNHRAALFHSQSARHGTQSPVSTISASHSSSISAGSTTPTTATTSSGSHSPFPTQHPNRWAFRLYRDNPNSLPSPTFRVDEPTPSLLSGISPHELAEQTQIRSPAFSSNVDGRYERERSCPNHLEFMDVWKGDTGGSRTISNLQLDTLKQLIAESEATGDFKKFGRIVHDVFSDCKRLSASFCEPGKLLDFKNVQECYNIIISKCPRDVANCLITGTLSLLDRVKHGTHAIEADCLPVFLIILENPLLMDPANQSEADRSISTKVLGHLCEVMCKLPPPFREKLCRHLVAGIETRRHEVTMHFQHVVSVFQHFITLRLLSRIDHTVTPNKDQAVINATMCLDMFYNLNDQHQLIPYTEFYNDAVNELIDIKEDFPNFKTGERFSFCTYPFILSPATKADILKIESMVQMRYELQDAFFRALFEGVNSPFLVLEVRRDHIIRDALYQLESRNPQDLKKQLKVQFVGEEGVDEGGVQKEFFQLVVREMFDRKYGMFKQNEESRLSWFYANPFDDESALDEYRLVGRMIGLAIYNSVILNVNFPLCLYKKLMNQPVGLDDLSQLDPTLGRGLQQLLDFDGDVEPAYNWTFQVELESFDGHRHAYDLKPNGSSIKLTNDNRKEFVDLYVSFLLTKSVERQFQAFKEGFDMVCANSAIRMFRPEEVEQLVCGSQDLDFEALEKVTRYDGGWRQDSPVIRNFWEIVHSFSDEQKKRLLAFTTGSDRVPIGGLAKLQFVIAKNGGDSDRLPTSHTCYNVLLLCEYATKEKLRERLITAISNYSEGFGMI